MAGTGLFAPKNSTVDVALNDSNGDAVLVRCTVANIPSAVSGYAYGCLLQATDTGNLYANTGGASSATFTLLEDAGGSFTLPITATDASSTTGNSVLFTESTLTSGKGINVVGATGVFTTGGALLQADLTAAVAGNGLNVVTTGAYTGTGLAVLTAGAMTTGIGLSVISTTGLTTGSLIRATSSTAGALATNGAVSIRGTGAYTSTSNTGLLDVQASATLTGTLVNLQTTAASQTATTILNIVQSGATLTAYTGSLVSVTGGFSGASSTGNAVLVTTVHTAAGDAVKLVNNALTVGTSTILNLSHTTSVLGAGNSMLRITSTGIDTGTTTGTLLDLASTAAQAATLMKITSASLTSGKGLVFTLAGLTTGAAIDTTGIAATTQNFNMNASTGSTAAPQTNAPAGFFKIGIGGTDQWVPYYGSS